MNRTTPPNQEISPEKRAAIRAARAQAGQGPDELIDRGEIDEPVPHGQFIELLELVGQIKHRRDQLGLSLTDVAERSGLTRAAVSRLENGWNTNPTLDTLYRYAQAVDLHVKLSVEELPPEDEGAPPMSIEIHRNPDIENDPQVGPLIARINALLEQEFDTGAVLTHVTWASHLDPKGRPLFTVTLRDAWGQVSKAFARNQIENPEGLRAVLHQLRGDLVQRAAPQ